MNRPGERLESRQDGTIKKRCCRPPSRSGYALGLNPAFHNTYATKSPRCHHVSRQAKKQRDPTERPPSASDPINPSRGGGNHNRVVCFPNQSRRPDELSGQGIRQGNVDRPSSRRSVHCRGSERIDGGELAAFFSPGGVDFSCMCLMLIESCCYRSRKSIF